MPLLPHDQILRLHKAVMSAGLAGSRDALLGGIDAAFVAGLPSAADASGRLLSDLHALNAVPSLDDGSAPLRTWLENAARLAGPRVEAESFHQALARLDAAPAPPTALQGPPAPDTSRPPVVFWVLAQLPVVGGVLAAALDKGPAAWLKAHWIAATVLTLAYEGVAGVGKKVWENLEPEVIQALTGLIRGTFLNLVSPFHRRYLGKVINEHRTFNVRGLREQGAFSIQLERVFVELRIAPNSALQASLDPLSGKELSGNRPVWDFLRMVAREEAMALAILGPPGSGKTTLLQHVALTMAAQRQRRHGLRSYVPLFLFLRDHTNTIAVPNPPSLGALAQAFFSRRPGLSPPPPGWFERQLQAGRCIVLLDGLDEVADEKHRGRVSVWVEEQITAYPRSPFILTARPLGYRSAPLKRAHVLEVQPFGPEQVRRFIHNWYLANEIMRAGGQEDAGIRELADARATDLLQRLRKQPALSDLTKNPLLLTMIATVHGSRNALPGRRVQLYAEICEVLLGHWRMAKGLEAPLTSDQIRVALEPLAAHMMEKRKREVAIADALSVLKAPLAEIGVTGQGAREFLPNLQAMSGLILERENGQWGFAHLTFQEYLAASHFRKQGTDLEWLRLIQDDWYHETLRLDGGDELVVERGLIQDDWWHETLRLYAAQGDATELLRAALSLDDVSALALASECLEEALKLNEAVRAQAEERLTAALGAADPERRRLAAEVRLARRLRALHHIDDRREIDLGYITCAEYQLFLDDARAQGRFLQPDHWKAYQFPPGQAQASVLGVRPGDAQAVAAWLTKHKADGWIYRVPTVAEAMEYPAAESTEQVAGWCSTDAEWRLVGLPLESNLALLERLRSLSRLPFPSSVKQSLTLTHAFGSELSRSSDTFRSLELDAARSSADRRVLKSAPAHARARARADAGTVKSALQSIHDNALPIADALDCVRRLINDLTNAGEPADALTAARGAAQALTVIRDRMPVYDRRSVSDHLRALSHAVASVEVIALALSRGASLPLRYETISRASGLARDLARDLARVVCRAIEVAFQAPGADDPRDVAFLQVFKRMLVRDAAFALSHASNVALALAHADASDLDEAHAKAHAFVYSFFSINTVIAREMVPRLFDSLVELLRADTPWALTQARHRHAVCCTECILTISAETSAGAEASWYQRRSSDQPAAEDISAKDRETILKLHWWFQAVMARAAGTLPAWEGIRLVRERRP